MPVNACGSIIGALPSPSVLLVLHSVQEMLASDDGLERHCFGSDSGIRIQINFIGVLNFFSLQILQIQGILEQGSQQGLGIFLLFLVLFLLENSLLGSSDSSFLITLKNLSLNTLDKAKRKKEMNKD